MLRIPIRYVKEGKVAAIPALFHHWHVTLSFAAPTSKNALFHLRKFAMSSDVNAPTVIKDTYKALKKHTKFVPEQELYFLMLSTYEKLKEVPEVNTVQRICSIFNL